MKKLATFAAIAVLTMTVPALATETTAEANQEVQSDAVAINKDNNAIAKQQGHREHHRAAKGQAKSTGDSMGQAKESVAIGANNVAIGEKKVEKKVDEKIMQHDQKDQQEAVESGNAAD